MSNEEHEKWVQALGRLQDSAMLIDELIWRIIAKLHPNCQRKVPMILSYAVADEAGCHRLTEAEMLTDIEEIHAVALGKVNLRNCT